MSVLLSSAGLENQELQSYFVNMVGKDMALVKALFVPTAAVNPGAIAVLPKCMNDLLKCGIPEENITVFDLHTGMDLDTLRQYDVVYLCGGRTAYLLERVNQTGFRESLLSYIRENGAVIGVSAGSLIFANNLPGNLGLIDTHLDVHCPTGAAPGKLPWPCPNLRLTNNCALAMDGFQVVGISE